jgi:uncharacterized OB-fold protein
MSRSAAEQCRPSEGRAANAYSALVRALRESTRGDLPMGATTGLTDTELVERFSYLRVDRDNAALLRGWLGHELRLNRCADCGHWHHPPRPMCPSCWSWNVVPTAVSGRGRVHLLMRLVQGPAAPGVDYSAGPYPVVTVELEEQPHLRYTSTMINIPAADVVIDMPVTLTWIDRHGAPFPVFEPADRAEVTS